MTKNIRTIDLEEVGIEIDDLWNLVTVVSWYFDELPQNDSPAARSAWVRNAPIYNSVISSIGGRLRDVKEAIEATLANENEVARG